MMAKKLVYSMFIFIMPLIFGMTFLACNKNNDHINFVYNIENIQHHETISFDNLNDYDMYKPTMNGFNFEGWYIDKDLKTKLNIEEIEPNSTINLYAKWSIATSYQVNIIAENPHSISFKGETSQTINKTNPNFNEVTITPNLGYKYLYYEIDGIKYNSNIISLTNITKNTNVKVVSEYATYELPIINIDTSNNQIDSKANYTDMNFSIENTANSLTNISGGIRLRGDSSLHYPKKPYRIKFDKKQSLLGLDSAKSWVLLAEYIDPSGLDNYAALTLGNKLDNLRFTATPNKVNVYLNGEYAGLYTLCEQVQENKGRLDIELDEITEDMTELKDFNFFVSMDYGVSFDATATEGVDYFYIKEYDKYIELKYPEKDQFVSEQQFNKFFSDLQSYMKYLFDIFAEKDKEKIEAEVNISSLVDFLLVDMIMVEADHAKKSFNMFYTNTSENSKENHKINFGPIWDYDSSGGKPWTQKPNISYKLSNSINYTNVFFEAIRDISDYQIMLKNRYKNYVSDVLKDIIANLYIIEASMRESYALNHQKWYVEFEKEISYEGNITDDNIIYLNKLLIHRKGILDKNFA